MERLFQWTGYLASAFLLKYLVFPSEVATAWSAGVSSRFSPVAIGFGGLLLAGFLSLRKPDSARILAVCGAGFLTLIWFPSILNLVRAPIMFLEWRNWLLIAVYFSAMAFILLYPHPFRSWGRQAMALLVIIPLLTATYHGLSGFVDYCRAESRGNVRMPVGIESLPRTGER